ncbi:MAG: GNAT family N-acetyltransferase [Alphaproteobacteria bacterium]|nr:GNAT family N-acetyltransferase [Alphaproteobacteria bacterium]
MIVTETFLTQAQPAPFSPIELTTSDIPQILDLIAAVRDALPEGEKHFLKPKTSAELTALLENGGSILAMKPRDEENLAALTIVNREKEDMAVLQSVCVHPVFKRLGLVSALMEHSEKWARENSISLLLAKVASANEKSLRLFASAGFRVARVGIDEELGYEFNIFAKSLPPLANCRALPSNGIYGTSSPAAAFAS